MFTVCLLLFSDIITQAKTIELHSSCNDITTDGLYYIKPSEKGAIIPVICSNGYVMIDLSLDINMNSYSSYLSSWDYGRNSMDYILPNLDDKSTFRSWWLLSDSNTKFTVAPNCNSCELSNNDIVYYSDSSLFCFSIYNSGDPCLDDIYPQYSCNKCDVIHQQSHCFAMRMNPDTPINYDHNECVTHGLLYRPSMSFQRNACNCYKPLQQSFKYIVNINDLPPVTSYELLPNNLYIDENIIFDKNNDIITGNNCNKNKIYLTNNDFKSGTYRIFNCGEYILTEDIIFNFNAPTIEQELDVNFSPNSIYNDELYWFPKHSDDINGKYSGLYSYIGSYSLGFFAGITIETNNVTINLNGYSISMNYKFYIQQRYFTLIEMGSKYFLPNQGPGNWDVNEKFYASNFKLIGPGILGLTSHHSIHGLRNNNIYIYNIIANRFDVAGIHCNGCTNIIIDKCKIGPQNNDIPVLGRYAHSRALLPRLKQLVDEYGENEIQFYEREPMKVEFVVQRLIIQMDAIYNFIVNQKKDEIISEFEWTEANKLFFNPSGIMDGGSSYGIVISGDGAAVVGIGVRIDNTQNIIISNTEIKGIYNNVIEKLKTGNDLQGAMRLILFDTIDWLNVISNEWIIDDNIENIKYIGDAYTDCIFTIYKYINSWLYLNSLFLTSDAINFVFNGGNPKGIFGHGIPVDGGASFTDGTATGCNTDIQLHSSKGAIGLRIDGGIGIKLNNINISEIKNYANLGANWCGEYLIPSVANEDGDIQYGYTGTRSHGIAIDYAINVEMKNIYINNIESFYGEANGIVIYKKCNIDINENIQINKINGGSMLNNDDVNKLILPNLIPRSCALDIRDNTIVRINTDIVQYDIFGFDHYNCYGIYDNEIKSLSFLVVIGICILILCMCVAIVGLMNMMRIQILSQCEIENNDCDEYTPLMSSDTL